MIEFKQNSKTFLDQKLTPKKCHDEFPNLQNSQRAVEDITHNKKGSQDMRVLPRYHESSDCFEYPKKSLLKSSYPPKNTLFSYQKKSFDHPCYFISGIPPWVLEAAIILETFSFLKLNVYYLKVVRCMTFDMITMYFTSYWPYNQHTGLGLRQPFLISLKTLPHTFFKIKYKGKLTLETWNLTVHHNGLINKQK